MSPTLMITALGLFAIGGFMIALMARRATVMGDASDYYLGGRALPGVVAGLSYAATTYSAFMMVGLAGFTYRGGVGALGFEMVYFAGLALLVIFGPRFWLASQRWGFVTPTEMIGARYGSPSVAKLMAALSIVFLIPYSALQMLGIGILLEGLSGGAIPFVAGVALACVLAAIWTLLGGLRSVAWTDAAQALIMMVSGLLAVWFVLDGLGGWKGLEQTLIETKPEWLTVPGPGFFKLKTFIALTLPWFFFSITNPQVSQRLFAIGSLASLRTMILSVLVFGFLFTLIAVVWGFSAVALFPDLSSPDQAAPTLLRDAGIPPIIALLVMVGIMAAAISTVDSIALTLSSMISRDIAGEQTGDTIGRVCIVIFIALTGGFAVLKLGLVAQLAILSATFLLVTIPAIVGAFFWSRGTAMGVIASLLLGTLALALVKWGGVSVPVLPLSAVGLITSSVAYVVVSLITQPEADALDFKADLKDELTRRSAW